MRTSRRALQLLEKIGKIEKMERGKVCRMTGRPHHNHQTWQGGRNVVRYVPAAELADLQQAIEGYELFTKLTSQYADEIIRLTRKERDKRIAATSDKGKRRNSTN